jgi:DnaK suppressor protein
MPEPERIIHLNFKRGDPMDKLQAIPYQQRLLGMREALLTQIAEQRGGVVSRAEAAAEHFGHSEDSSAQVATERELDFAIGERETAELAVIDAALARIEAGTYGQCTDCGVAIAAGRLEASPDAPRCIHCQEKVERQSLA